MKISVSMIVRNERSCIAKALNSVADADEIIVCDTGSTDDTVEIAQNYGAKVFTDYLWNDNFSDARLKHDIRETTPALQRLMEVNVVDYVMNGDKTGRVRTGVIAQQILPLFPQMVEGNENDYYSVNYPKLAAVAIKAIQELSEKVERLENILAENGISE